MSAVSCGSAPQATPERMRSGSSPIGARRLTALGALITLALLAGCSSGNVTTASPSTSAPESMVSSGPSTPVPEPASPSGSPPETGTSTTGATAWPTDEVPFDPIQRTVTGIVERTAGCTVLVVGQSRWVLTGSLVDSLTAGSRMTVTGNLTHRPPACTNEAGPELQVTKATPA